MRTEDILSIKDLSLSFGGLSALNNVSINIKKNSITSLIGPNGAGKTTLFNCITGFYQSQGEVLFQTSKGIIDIKTLLGEQLRLRHFTRPIQMLRCLYYKMFGGPHRVANAGIARTFQNIRLFKEMTVIENVLVASHLNRSLNFFSGIFNTDHYIHLEKTLIKQAYYWLGVFNLADDANRLAKELPFGKQRLLEIARCLCINPTLLCLDEPAAGLNATETQDLQKKMIALKQEHALTIILVEHDMSLVMNVSDEIVVLDQGRVICAGLPETVRHDKRVIEAYLGDAEIKIDSP